MSDGIAAAPPAPPILFVLQTANRLIFIRLAIAPGHIAIRTLMDGDQPVTDCAVDSTMCPLDGQSVDRSHLVDTIRYTSFFSPLGPAKFFRLLNKKKGTILIKKSCLESGTIFFC